MNKYLSYKKSKRLAELGYKPERYEGIWLVRTTPNFLGNLEKPKFFTCSLCEKGDGWYPEGIFSDYTPKKDYAVYYAPDCHDLLMELQKGNFRLQALGLKLSGFYCQAFGGDGDLIEESDLNPVEALGAALIKLLEEKP